MASPILVGAVIYEPKVAVIWDIIKDFFAAEGCPIDCVFYTQLRAAGRRRSSRATSTSRGTRRWPGWTRSAARAGGAARWPCATPTATASPTRRPQGRRPQVPGGPAGQGRRHRRQGLAAGDVDPAAAPAAAGARGRPGRAGAPVRRARRQTRRSRRRRARGARVRQARGSAGRLRARPQLAAVGTADGTADPARLSVLATTPRFDHCNFTVAEGFPEERARRWTDVLFRMSYDNPAHREMMDLEGLKAWLPGRTTGLRHPRRSRARPAASSTPGRDEARCRFSR